MTTLTIREARLDEASTLSRIAFRSKAHWGYTAAFMDACRAELNVTVEALSASNVDFFVAVNGEEIVGFYAIAPVTAGKFELESLFVEPAVIGTGVGKALVCHAKQRASALGGRSLLIQSDPNATGFYQAAGAVHCGNRESESIPGRLLPLLMIDLS